MRIGVTGISAVAALLAALGLARAQMPPVPSAPGFVSTYEIVHTLRAAGFDPLAPPLREGTIYVARATDYRGILMRVVLDARTGAIRDANRIVPGPGNYGGSDEPYDDADDGSLYAPGPYGPPGPYGGRPYGPEFYGRTAAAPYDRPPASGIASVPPPARPASSPSLPPLPRPRPPELAARQPSNDAKAINPKPAAVSDAKPEAKPDVKASAPTPAAPPPAAAQAATPPSPPRQPPSALTINN